MPLLRHNAIQLLEASMESLNLALLGLSMPARVDRREPGAAFAPHIGLVGAALEQALAACLVQVYGDEALYWDDNDHKSSHEILEDFRRMLDDPAPRTGFLTDGVEDPHGHRRRLASRTEGFGPLLTWRGAGLHGGLGPGREVCLHAAQRVVGFLDTLRASSRIRPYLETLPRPRAPLRERRVLIQDLLGSMTAADGLDDRARALSSLFLVLPDVPVQPPAWLRAFERVTVAPEHGDVAFLLQVLRDALPVDLEFTATGDRALPVRVDPDHPDAVPVAPGLGRRSFTRRRDQWVADVGNANGRLARGTLDLPPRESVQAAFVMGADQMRHAMGAEALSAEQAWPFIAASLKQQGSAGPYWFLVRAVEHELDELEDRLKRALDLVGGRTGALRRQEVMSGIAAIREAACLAADSPLSRELAAALPEIERTRRELVDNLGRADEIERPVPDDFARLVTDIAHGRRAAGDALEALAAGEVATDGASQNYWARVLCRACSEYGDRIGLHAVLRSDELSGAHSNARKALRHIDAATFGPRFELEETATAAAQ